MTEMERIMRYTGFDHYQEDDPYRHHKEPDDGLSVIDAVPEALPTKPQESRSSHKPPLSDQRQS